jgi:hypothetical protein
LVCEKEIWQWRFGPRKTQIRRRVDHQPNRTLEHVVQPQPLLLTAIHGRLEEMLRSRSRVFLFIFTILACLGVYSNISRRHHRTAEKLRLEREYLSWDWSDTPEEIACQSAPTGPTQNSIPNVVHFILIAEEHKEAELEFYQYLAVKAALLRLNPEAIKIHTYAFNTSNEWWQRTKHRADLVIHEPQRYLRTSDGRDHKLRLAHQTDVMRLEILRDQGGIYLDTDVYALRSFSSLLQSPKDLLMGHEGGGRIGLGNAVIVARPGSTFISRWLEKYHESFDDRPKMWNHHSIVVPVKLAEQHPEEICKLSPSTFFWPTWSSADVALMHQPIFGDELSALERNMSQYSGAMYPNQLAYHAWGNIARREYLSKLTPEFLLGVQTRFNILLREIHNTEI